MGRRLLGLGTFLTLTTQPSTTANSCSLLCAGMACLERERELTAPERFSPRLFIEGLGHIFFRNLVDFDGSLLKRPHLLLCATLLLRRADPLSDRDLDGPGTLSTTVRGGGRAHRLSLLECALHLSETHHDHARVSRESAGAASGGGFQECDGGAPSPQCACGSPCARRKSYLAGH